MNVLSCADRDRAGISEAGRRRGQVRTGLDRETAAVGREEPARMSLPLPSAIFAEAPSRRMVAALVEMTSPPVLLAWDSSIVPEYAL